MGCCFAKGIKDDWADTIAMPEGVVRLTVGSDPDLLAKAEECAASSFCGSRTVAPEPVLSWAFDPKASGDDPSAPLQADPSEERLAVFRWIMKFVFATHLRHGAIFAVMDGDEVAGVSICVPPNTTNAHDPNLCTIMSAGSKAGSPPAAVNHPRFKAAEAAMKRKHREAVNRPHWYIYIFATNPKSQGKGVGTKMVRFCCSLADTMNCPAYLETAGARREAFYASKGRFTAVGPRIKITDPKRFSDVFDLNGGLTGMVYTPAKTPSSAAW